MASYSEVYEEKTRVSAPDPSAAYNLASNNITMVRYMWSVTAKGGSTDEVIGMKLQDSDNGTDWLDVPDGAFASVSGNVILEPQFMEYVPFRKYVRAVPSHSGTTKSSTWSLEAAYLSVY